jgi:AraC-like DNA-binding protein
MIAHPGDTYTVESLAARASMSRSAFASHFQQAFGQPPLGALHEIRMQRAAQLLRNDRRIPVAQVAHDVGFRSRSRFSEAFKARFALTPAVFRAASRLDG